MAPHEYSNAFERIFTGNKGFYVEHLFDIDQKKTKKADKLKSEAYFKDAPVTEAHYLAHLKGAKGLGICPVNEDNKSKFGVIDIDVYNVSYTNLVHTIYENGLPLFPFRTKSGGLHLYLFLKREVSSKSVIESLNEVCDALGLRETYQSAGKTKVEVIPKQARLTKGGHGNTITIPYFRCDKAVSYLYAPNMSAMSIEEALSAIHKGSTSLDELKDALKGLPYADAPKCIQTILLSPSMDEDSGRNNFLFSCAVYLKKKHGDDYYEKLLAINETFNVPLEEVAVRKTYESVNSNEYHYKCNDIPCQQYCNKSICAKREFGVGKEKGHFNGVEYGLLTRYKSAEPYYVWELKKLGKEKFSKITFKNSMQIMDQKFFIATCIDQLSYAPFQLSNADWTKIVNTSLESIVEVVVETSSDTSATAAIRDAFYEYLTQRKARPEMSYQIKLGLVVNKEGKLYFTAKGFQDYLDVNKLKIVYGNLRETLLSFGAKESFIEYVTRTKETKKVQCWEKEIDLKLRELVDYYEDVLDGDIGIIDSNKSTVDSIDMEETQEEDAVEEEMSDDEALF